MTIGLSFEELTRLSSFGTRDEIRRNVYKLTDPTGETGPDTPEIIDNAIMALQRKMVELISQNNARITDQLAKAGVKLL
jgi:hypothetical protein